MVGWFRFDGVILRRIGFNLVVFVGGKVEGDVGGASSEGILWVRNLVAGFLVGLRERSNYFLWGISGRPVWV